MKYYNLKSIFYIKYINFFIDIIHNEFYIYIIVIIGVSSFKY